MSEKEGGEYATEFESLESDIRLFDVTMHQAAQTTGQGITDDYEKISKTISHLHNELNFWKKSVCKLFASCYAGNVAYNYPLVICGV